MGVSAAVLAAGTLAGAFPQMLAWHVLYGEWVLLDPPHGADFLRLGRPFVLETLFSSRHGLLSWTPVLWLGYLGLRPLMRTRRALALPLLLPVAVMTYVNMCSGDWWAGGSFSNRRFDSLLPLLALGIAASVEWLAGVVARRPALVPAALAVAAGAWNVALVDGVRGRGAPATSDRVRGECRGRRGADGGRRGQPAHLAGELGLCLASSPGRRDSTICSWAATSSIARTTCRAGSTSARRATSPCWARDGARLSCARVWPRGRCTHAGASSRPSTSPRTSRSRCAPMPTGAVAVRVEVNGREAGAFTAGPGWGAHRLRVARDRWRRDLNDVVLEGEAAGVWVDAVDFIRAGVPEGQERGFRAR